MDETEEMLDDISPARIVLNELQGLIEGAIALLPALAAALVILVLTWAAAWLAGATFARLLRRSRARPSLIEAMTTLTHSIVWIVGLMVAAMALFPNLTPANLVAGLGIGSIAVGLAFRDTFENFLAGFLILLRRPMRIGDDIRCEGVTGRVERITIRDTYVRKRSGELTLLPNSYLFKNPVEVLTDRDLRRISLVVGVAYGEDVDEARAVIQQAMEPVAADQSDRGVQVFATTFNAYSVDFMVRWWVASAPIDEHRSRDRAVSAIKQALDAAGIEIPFPYRTLTFKHPLSLARESGEPEAADRAED